MRGVLVLLVTLAVPAAAAPVHDSVVVPLRSQTVRIRAHASEIRTTVRVTVRNADILPQRETPGHMIRLLASDGDCPAGTIASAPDFDRKAAGAQDSVLVKGGTVKTAAVALRITASAFTSLNSKTPTRCTLRFTAYTLPFGDSTDPTPSNNFATLELNILDANDANQSVPETFVGSAGGAVVVKASAMTPTKHLRLKAGNGNLTESGGHAVTITAADGDCPAGVTGAFDFDTKAAGVQNPVTIVGGSTATGTLSLTIDPAAFPQVTRAAPFRCTATVSAAGVGGDSDASNDATKVVIDVTGGTAVPTPVPTVPLPALSQSDPIDGATQVPTTKWIRLQLGGAIEPVNFGGFDLSCNGQPQSLTTYLLAPTVLVVNPDGSLPAGGSCILAWEDTGGPVQVSFSTAAAGAAVTVSYDRTDSTRTAPFPDDFWLQADASTRTGVRVAMAVPGFPPTEQGLFAALLNETNQLDGFSPIGHVTLEVSDIVDPASVPTTREQSVDPLASIGLFDLDPKSPTVGSRIPFQLDVRNDTSTTAVTTHSLLIFPSIPLSPRGHYGVVVTRGALVDATRPVGPSAFFSAALAAPVSGEDFSITRVRTLANEVIDAVAQYSALPIPADDVALAVRISVRSTDDIPSDLLAIRAQVYASPPPVITITSVQPETHPGSNVIAFVHGTWQAPDFRGDGFNFQRDSNGKPVQTTTNVIPFILALPLAALNGPVPVTMYQHGNPGDPETEVPTYARREIAGAGLALIGFRDVLNREISPTAMTPVEAGTQQVTATLIGLLQNQKIPDYWMETNAEQIAFVRAIQQLGTLDVLPLGSPDGVPDLNVTAPITYLGISEGAVHAPGLLPYQPAIRAAALVAGGSRAVETIIHQQASVALDGVGMFYPNLTPTDLWVGFGIFQMDFDRQDTHNHAPFIYRHPVKITGAPQRASILLMEGLDDSLVPNNATDSLAWTLGPIPHIQPVQRSVPFLTLVTAPLVANINPTTTAGFYQYVPAGVSGIDPTPGCEMQPEGHFCPQIAPVASAQRVAFFLSAISNAAPTIIDPLAP